MTTHVPEHDDLLLAVAVGDLPNDDEAVVRRRAECERCAAKLETILRVAGLLDEDAREEQRLLALAQGLEGAPGEDRIRAFRERPEFRRPGGRAGPRSAFSPRRLRAAWVTLAAAAALVLVFLAGRWTLRDTPEPPRLLGGDERIALTAPLGATVAFARFSWIPDESVTTAGVRSYILLVEGDGFFDEIADLTDSEWSDLERARAFPDEIEWWVEAYDASGQEIARSQRGSARRSP